MNKKGKFKLKHKLKETLKLHEEEKAAFQQSLQDVKTEKAETCNALRTEFGAALDSRDDMLSGLRKRLEALKTEKLGCEEKYETENRELISKITESDEKSTKWQSKVTELKASLESVSAELSRVRHEKDNIGDTIRAEFDHICSGLRQDLERVLKERDEIARAMEVRLQIIYPFFSLTGGLIPAMCLITTSPQSHVGIIHY